ncbi:hypothetical protein Nmel_014018 [Mimus melanotis]
MAGRSQDRSLREELTCAICCELFSEPVMLDCMHHFCRGCIQEYWDHCAHGPSCPQCRRRFPSPAFRTHYLLSGLVDKVRRCGSQEHQHKMQKHLEDALQARQKEMENLLQRKRVVQEDICSLTKVSGELNFKIRAEFAHLHQILEEEERTVLAELGEKEEQSLAHLHRQVGQLEEGMAVLQRDIEHVKQTLSRMEDVSLLEVRCSADSGRRLRDVSGSQIGMRVLNDSTRLYPKVALTAIPLDYLPNPLESGDFSHKGYSDIRSWEPSSFSIQVPRFPQDAGPGSLVSSLCCVAAGGGTTNFVQLHKLE